MAFAPDGKTLVTGCSDGVVRLWDLGTKETAAAPRGAYRSSSLFRFYPRRQDAGYRKR